MSSLERDTLVQTLITKRLEANKWTGETLAQYWSFHIDGEGSDDGVYKRIETANLSLERRFKMVSQCISTDDIQKYLDKVAQGDPDWLAYLDIAVRMAQANPSALNCEQTQQLVGLTRNTSEAGNPHMLPETVSRSLEGMGLRAA